jgi:uncharacterized protein involved in exopolysaccharide biosynthesis
MQMTAADDEIGIYDLWLVVRRRWRLVLTLFAVVSVAALAFAATLPKRYEFISLLEIGQVSSVGGSRPIESLEVTRLRLEKSIVPRVRRELAGPTAVAAPSVKIGVLAGQGVVTLTSAAPEEQRAKVEALHAAVADALRTQHAQRLEQDTDNLLAPLQAAVNALEAHRQALHQEITSASVPSTSRPESEPRQAFLLASRLTDLRWEAFQIDEKIADRQREMESIRRASRETRVTELASQADRPVGPGRELIVAMGFVLGLMMGVIGAFIVDFFANAGRAGQAAGR